jgi:hypothetical protein
MKRFKTMLEGKEQYSSKLFLHGLSRYCILRKEMVAKTVPVSITG